jgi:hypothetical protein
MFDLDLLKNQLLAECREDHVGLWSLIWQIRSALNEGEYPVQEKDRTDPREIRHQTLELVRELLDSGLVQVGYPTPDGRSFQPWSLPSSAILERIKSEWDALGREPDIGEIAWFTTKN